MFLLCGAIPASAQGEITDVQVQVSNPKQTVTITGAFDSRVSGRLATLQVLAEGIKLDEAADLDAQMRENVIFAWQTESEANGVFTFTIVMEKEAEPGDYYYLIGGEDVEQPYVSFFSYVGLEEVNKVVEKINSAASSEALRKILLEEYDVLGY